MANDHGKTGLKLLARSLFARLKHGACDRGGAIAVIFVVTLVPLIAAGGAAVDISRAYLVKQRLGIALDAAGLAVGSSTGDNAALQQIMQRYFDANYPVEEVGTPATPQMSIADNVITITATASVSSTLMRVVGVNTISVGASTTIVRETKGLDVVLVLDNSGSMGGSKISALKTASRDFVDILFGEDAEADNLQMGIVPFTSTVNIGVGMRNPYTRGPGNSQFSPEPWGGCVEARGGQRDRKDNFDSTINNRKWRRYLFPDTPNGGLNNWKGSGGSVSGDRGQFRGPNRFCPVELLPLTNVKATVQSKIDSMEANGLTHINLGAVWGWRVISPEDPFTEGQAFNDDEFDKAVVIMSDGENFISSNSESYTAYGFLSQGRLGTTSANAAEDEMDARLLTVCTRMKNRGILVYTITFQVSSSALRDLMRDCATDAGKYFDSPSNEELQATFRAIGAQLSNLRIGS